MKHFLNRSIPDLVAINLGAKMATLQSLNDAATAVQTAVATLNTAAAQAESVAVDVRINYAVPAGTSATPGVMTHQGIVVATSLPLV